MIYILCLVVAGVFLFVAWACDWDGRAGGLGVAGIALAVSTGIVSCENSGWNQEMKRAQREREKADAQPRVVREVDGCKVYAFKSTPSATHWTYFTRCPDSKTSTESSHDRTVRSGKTTRTVTDTETVEVSK